MDYKSDLFYLEDIKVIYDHLNNICNLKSD